MQPREFFNFLRYEKLSKIASIDPKIVQHLFGGENHYERFLEFLSALKARRLRRTLTESYVLFYDPLESSVYIFIYDPEKDTIYCDILLDVAHSLFSDIASDLDVLSSLYRVPSGCFRVQGDLYVCIKNFGSVVKLFADNIYTNYLYKITSYHGPLNDAYVCHFIKKLLSLPKTKKYFKFPRSYDLWPSQVPIKILNELYDMLPTARGTIASLIGLLEGFTKLLDEFSDYLFTRPLFSLPEYIRGLLYYRDYIDDAFRLLSEVLSKIRCYYWSEISDILMNIKNIYRTLSDHEQDFVIRSLQLLLDIRTKYSYLLYKVRRLSVSDILSILSKQARVFSVNLVRGSGRPHNIIFIGVRLPKDQYLVFSDIVISHNEHGKVIIPINSINPLYPNISNLSMYVGNNYDYFHAALVEFRLA